MSICKASEMTRNEGNAAEARFPTALNQPLTSASHKTNKIPIKLFPEFH
jgi:hypothetical protein